MGPRPYRKKTEKPVRFDPVPIGAIILIGVLIVLLSALLGYEWTQSACLVPTI
ncbi:MAG: hypothetical protein KC777_21855 [Cyanobacteria bacterium HKST-UBA02]|nr:hypothetical protein [Cyanobacteria bacterium HKST-UBA02]